MLPLSRKSASKQCAAMFGEVMAWSSECAWPSTQGPSSSAPSAPTCAPTTPRRVRRPASPRSCSASPNRVRSCSPAARASLPPAATTSDGSARCRCPERSRPWTSTRSLAKRQGMSRARVWPRSSHSASSRRVDPVLEELLAQRVPVDAEDLRRPHLVAGRLAQHRAEQRLLDEADHQVVEVRARVLAQTPDTLDELALDDLLERRVDGDRGGG